MEYGPNTDFYEEKLRNGVFNVLGLGGCCQFPGSSTIFGDIGDWLFCLEDLRLEKLE
jgi:hypothetical protein